MSDSQKLEKYVHSDGKPWSGFFIDRSSGIIYFRKKHRGNTIRFSTGETNPTRARRIATLEFEARLKGGTRRNGHVEPLLSDEIKSWLRVKESENLAEDTMNNVRRAGRQIGEFWNDKLPSDINTDGVAAWKEFWADVHSDISMENAVKYFRAFCKYLHGKVWGDRSLLPVIPKIIDPNAKETKRLRKKKKERVFTALEFKRVCDTAPDEEAKLAVTIMYTMATRVSETLALEFDETIFMDEKPPLYRWKPGQNKADLDGEHALPSILIPRLKLLRSVRRGQGTTLLFPQQRDNRNPLKEQQIDWGAWRERADLGWHWTPHTLRHTCLTNLFNDPKNAQAIICKLYRVSLAVALDTYVKVRRESILSMRDAIEVLP